jgi:TonB family protein
VPNRKLLKKRGLAVLAAVLIVVPAIAQVVTHPSTRNFAAGRVHLTVRILSSISPSDRAILRKGWAPLVQRAVTANWRPLLPDTVRPPMARPGTTVVVFRLGPGGHLHHLSITRSSGDKALDQAARGAVTSAMPYPPFPPGFPSRPIRLRIIFHYD